MNFIARVECQTAQPDHRPGERDVRHAERARPWERQERREDRRSGEQPGGGHPGTPGPPGRQAVPGAGDQLLQEAARDRGEQVKGDTVPPEGLRGTRGIRGLIFGLKFGLNLDTILVCFTQHYLEYIQSLA